MINMAINPDGYFMMVIRLNSWYKVNNFSSQMDISLMYGNFCAYLIIGMSGKALITRSIHASMGRSLISRVIAVHVSSLNPIKSAVSVGCTYTNNIISIFPRVTQWAL